jgi:hypothetical protein
LGKNPIVAIVFLEHTTDRFHALAFVLFDIFEYNQKDSSRGF